MPDVRRKGKRMKKRFDGKTVLSASSAIIITCIITNGVVAIARIIAKAIESAYAIPDVREIVEQIKAAEAETADDEAARK